MPTRRILIDAGHGGTTPIGGSSPNRAVGPNGLQEKDVALDLARRIRARLNGGSQVLLTRDDDVNLSLAQRTDLARRSGADVFLSLHLNGSHDPSENRADAYVARGAGDASQSFAESLARRVAHVGGMSYGGVRRADLGVLLPERHANSTLACLLELGHLTNPHQARRLEDPSYRDLLADALCDAIETSVVPRYRSTSALGRDAGPAPSVFTLSDSVGTGGANKNADVLALKQRLHDLGYDWIATGDATVNNDLTTTINLFQSIIAGRHSVRGDGRVDVPGTTYNWLRATNAPRWQLMPEGSEAEGYINFERRDDTDDHDNGVNWMAETISGAGDDYREDYLTANPNAAVIAVNDVSKPRGGRTDDHAGHQTGLACDLRLARTDGEAGGINVNSPNYDRNATRAQLQALRAQPLIDRIFLNDPTLIAEGLCEHVSGHENHIHFEIRPPARVDPGSSSGLRFDRSLAVGDGPPFTKRALEVCMQALRHLKKTLSKSSNVAKRSRDAIKSETGVNVDDNPYYGVRENEIEAVIRAGFESTQMPEVLLALWAKEGSTNSADGPVTVNGATSATNAKTLYRTHVYYVDLGADFFMVTTRKPGEDNKVDFSDSAAAGHEKRFKAAIKDLVKDGVLDEDISSEINDELTVTRSGGKYQVEPSTRFYALSLLLVDALFTKFQNKKFPQLASISADLNYLQWNMGTATFKKFLESADGHRKEKEHLVDGNPISIEQWALHTKPKDNEWKDARKNAMRFMHYRRSYRDIFEPHANLIKPGIDDLRERHARTAGHGGGSAQTTLGYGVPDGRITDPFYRNRTEKGKERGRSKHFGIDVGHSNAKGGDEHDDRRGLPVYAAMRPTLDIDDLNSTPVAVRKADKSYENQSGLGIRGSGVATLREARVNVQPWEPGSGNAYGGIIGLACYYDYTKNDGTAGSFTLYVEYLHLITEDYLPKRGDGSIISESEWAATGKGIGFGPKMVNGATLTAAELTGASPTLIGYLGATQFPHVHIQVAYSEKKKKYIRSPRFSPAVVLQDALSATLATPFADQSVDVGYTLSLIPQPDKKSCWAASMAMVVAYYRQQSVSAENVVNEVGLSLRTSYGWSALEDVADHFGFNNVPLPSNMSFAPTPQEWYDWLVDHGPLWVTTHGAPSHAIVVHGIRGDLTPDGTTVDVMDPWDYTKRYDSDPIDFNPPNNGLELRNIPFKQLQRDFANMQLSDFGNWRVLYISNTPVTAASAFGGGDSPSPFTDPIERAINRFGGIIFDPAAYDHSVEGFQEYLDATGVKHFSAEEITTPHHPKIAKKHGYDYFLPKYEWWPRGAALALLADRIRDLVGEPVTMRNWWRPAKYNKDVGGAAQSDHITAHGVDLDYKSADSRRKAEKWLKQQDKDAPWLELSMGLGNRTTHVGIQSPKGGRRWHYKSYTQSLDHTRNGAYGLSSNGWSAATQRQTQANLTGPLTNSDWDLLQLWLEQGEVGVAELTGDPAANALIVAGSIFCSRLGVNTDGEDPLLCIAPEVTQADHRVQQLVQHVEARGPIVNWARVDPDDRILAAMRLLVNTHGLPVNGAAGLVGNLFAESGVMPPRLEGSAAATPLRTQNFARQRTDFTGEQVMNRNRSARQGPRPPGVGLAQWTTAARRSGLFQHQFSGRPAGPRILFDMEAQIDYLNTELNGAFRRVNNVLRRANVTVDAASDEVLMNFERPRAVLQDGRLRARTDPQVQAVLQARRRLGRRALRVWNDANRAQSQSYDEDYVWRT